MKFNYNEDLVYRNQLTYNDIVDTVSLKYIPKKRTRFSLNPGIYEVVDSNDTLKYILPDYVKVSATIDDVRLKSNLEIIQPFLFSEKSIFYTLLGFTRSRSYRLDDIAGVYQLIAGSYESENPNNNAGI